LVLDKIEAEDNKKEVMCICFGYTQRKQPWLELSMKGWPWPDLRALWPAMVSSPRGGGGRGGEGQGPWLPPVHYGGEGGGAMGEGVELSPAASFSLLLHFSIASVRKRRKEKGEKRKE
jgi:hypothetical protein